MFKLLCAVGHLTLSLPNTIHVQHQTLPRHMRRRATSHDVKRLPVRLRKQASAVRGPLPTLRNRYIMLTVAAQLGGHWQETANQPEQQASRHHRRRPRNLLEQFARQDRDYVRHPLHPTHSLAVRLRLRLASFLYRYCSFYCLAHPLLRCSSIDPLQCTHGITTAGLAGDPHLARQAVPRGGPVGIQGARPAVREVSAGSLPLGTHARHPTRPFVRLLGRDVRACSRCPALHQPPHGRAVGGPTLAQSCAGSAAVLATGSRWATQLPWPRHSPLGSRLDDPAVVVRASQRRCGRYCRGFSRLHA